MDQSGETQRQISSCLLDLSNKIERLIVSHTELAENITKLKEAVYNPDEGIYARIPELEREIVKNGEVRMAKAEDTIIGVKKLQWMVIGTTAAAVVAVFFKTIGL